MDAGWLRPPPKLNPPSSTVLKSEVDYQSLNGLHGYPHDFILIPEDR
jgi:hypothetical protein